MKRPNGIVQAFHCPVCDRLVRTRGSLGHSYTYFPKHNKPEGGNCQGGNLQVPTDNLKKEQKS